jgi:Uma2 family endonuclease
MRRETAKKLFTVDEYYRMAVSGILSEEIRTELINGEIVERCSMRAQHAAAVSRVTDLLLPLLKGRALFRSRLPLRLSEYNEPQPDLTFVKARRDYYVSRHPGPGDTLLAVDISDTVLPYDREVKITMYAAARIPEYWIADLADDVLRVFRDPAVGTYKTSRIYRRGDAMTPVAFPDNAIQVSELLG